MIARRPHADGLPPARRPGNSPQPQDGRPPGRPAQPAVRSARAGRPHPGRWHPNRPAAPARSDAAAAGRNRWSGDPCHDREGDRPVADSDSRHRHRHRGRRRVGRWTAWRRDGRRLLTPGATALRPGRCRAVVDHRSAVAASHGPDRRVGDRSWHRWRSPPGRAGGQCPFAHRTSAERCCSLAGNRCRDSRADELGRHPGAAQDAGQLSRRPRQSTDDLGRHPGAAQDGDQSGRRCGRPKTGCPLRRSHEPDPPDGQGLRGYCAIRGCPAHRGPDHRVALGHPSRRCQPIVRDHRHCPPAWAQRYRRRTRGSRVGARRCGAAPRRGTRRPYDRQRPVRTHVSSDRLNGHSCQSGRPRPDGWTALRRGGSARQNHRSLRQTRGHPAEVRDRRRRDRPMTHGAPPWVPHRRRERVESRVRRRGVHRSLATQSLAHRLRPATRLCLRACPRARRLGHPPQ